MGRWRSSWTLAALAALAALLDAPDNEQSWREFSWWIHGASSLGDYLPACDGDTLLAAELLPENHRETDQVPKWSSHISRAAILLTPSKYRT